MPRQPRIGIGGSGAGQRLVDTKRLFTTAIGLAWDIDHRHNRALHGFIGVSGDGFADHFCQRPSFQQADFTLRRTREVVVGVRYHGDKTHRFTVQLAVCGLHGRA